LTAPGDRNCARNDSDSCILTRLVAGAYANCASRTQLVPCNLQAFDATIVQIAMYLGQHERSPARRFCTVSPTAQALTAARTKRGTAIANRKSFRIAR